jgi:hypothetical protein
VVDCDDVHRGYDLLKQVRRSRANRSSALVAVLNGTTAEADARDQGAVVTLAKPLEAAALKAVLAPLAARCGGNTRSHPRITVDVAGYVSFGDVFDRAIQIKNVSAGGLGFRASEPPDGGEALTVRFALPAAGEIRCSAELAWSDPSGSGGMKWRSIPREQQQALERWLATKLRESATFKA